MGLAVLANVDLQHNIKCDIDPSKRLRWLAGYGCVVGAAKYWFDS